MRASLDQIILAQETDFTLGGLSVSPSKRQVFAGDAREVLQPRIMQVLVALSARRGEVVSRDELMARCWGGFAVSDDAIHRCIARLRRLAEAHGGFKLETVTRVGYQLMEVEEAAPHATPWHQHRMAMLGVGLVAGGLLVAAVGLFGAHFM